jgi:hypothetical protein
MPDSPLVSNKPLTRFIKQANDRGLQVEIQDRSLEQLQWFEVTIANETLKCS